jgi:3-phenylpropionate/cinnamic acid dioxygenase small subunit
MQLAAWVMSDATNQIHNLLYRYAEAIDAGDFDAVGELFAHGRMYQSYEAPDSTTGGKSGPELTAQLRELVVVYDDGTPRTRHVTTNPILEVDERTSTANARSYVTVWQQAERDGAIELIACSRYHDRFECADGVWRFAERRVVRDFRSALGGHVRGPLD